MLHPPSSWQSARRRRNGWRAYPFVLIAACVLASSCQVRADTGHATASRSRAFWIKRPYALHQPAGEPGRTGPNLLVLGRDARLGDGKLLQGVVPTQTLLEGIERTAITSAFAVMELANGEGLAALDLEQAEPQVERFPDEPALLAAHGSRISPQSLVFRDFDDWYHRRVEVPTRTLRATQVGLAMALVLLLPGLRRLVRFRMGMRAWLVLSTVLYMGSLALPAIDGASGLFCLIGGAAFFLSPQTGWWANPLLAVGSLFLLRKRPGFALVANLPAALSTTAAAFWSINPLQPGYWLWVLTAAVLVMAADDHWQKNRAARNGQRAASRGQVRGPHVHGSPEIQGNPAPGTRAAGVGVRSGPDT